MNHMELDPVVWTFVLSADADNHPATTSDPRVRASIWPPHRKEAILASEACCQAMEGSPEWMLKVAHRRRVDPTGPWAVRLTYGNGLETILLVDGAEAPSSQTQMDRLPTIPLGLSMVNLSSSETPLAASDAVVSFSSPMNLICRAAGNDPQSIGFAIRVLDHALSMSRDGADGPTLDRPRRHIVRLETLPDNVYAAKTCELVS